MKIPWWLVLLVFLGYSYWSVNYWHCYKCQCCAGASPAAVAQASGAPLFKWSAAQPEPDSNFSTWKKAFLAKGGQGDTLLITGLYRTAETFTGKTGNLGIARATALRNLMMPEMPENRIRVDAKLVSDDWTATGDPKQCAEFAWSKMILKKEEGAIIESDNVVTFLFPFNSTEKDNNPAVDEYLKKLVEKHKALTTTFAITGHTDDVGEPDENIKLGLGRANSIAKILITNGINANRIKVDSKGEAEPLADNATEDGRHQNRRVSITVNK
jgi:outer membrane protein OmpA-like peptidoglycan-associated protein